MPLKKIPRIASVKAFGKGLVLAVTWQNGWQTKINVKPHMAAYVVYRVLRANMTGFKHVSVGEFGSDVVWPGGEAIAAETLWRLALEQAGYTMSAQGFREWRQRNGMTLDAAAEALGLSRRMVAYYEHGERLVPRVVALATKTLDAT